jgi:hypothetical protein
VQCAVDIWRGPSAGASPDGKVIDLETGGYQRNSAVGKIFQTLKDGDWHSAQELEKKIAGKADLSGRIYRIEKRGAKRGLWKLEEKNGEYRLQFYAKANV